MDMNMYEPDWLKASLATSQVVDSASLPDWEHITASSQEL